MNLWNDGNGTDMLPEIDDDDFVVAKDECDNISVQSFDLTELGDADGEFNSFADDVPQDNETDSADSILAWSALGMLMGLPAPKYASRKNRKVKIEVAKQLWGGDMTGIYDALDKIPSIDPDEDEIAIAPSSLSDQPSNDWKWCAGQYSQEDSGDDDTYSLPSLSEVPSLSNTTVDEESDQSSPSNSCTDFNASPIRETNSETLTDSVLAWGAFAAFMGHPAPKAILRPKRKKEVRDLWGEEGHPNGYGSVDLSELSIGI